MNTPMSDERLAEIRAMRWTETSRHFVREFRDADEKFLWVQGAAHYTARVELVAEVDRLRAELAAERGPLPLVVAVPHGRDCTVGLCGWHRIHAERFERMVDGVLWALDDLDDTEIGPNDPGAGWYLYGPGPFAVGRFLVWSETVPTAGADAVIRTHRYLACDCCGRVGEVRNMAGIRLCAGNTTGLGGPCPTPSEATA